MNVTFFSESDKGACFRYRVALPVRTLNAGGKVRAQFSMKWEPAVAKEDIYIFQRNHMKEALQLLHKLAVGEKRIVIYDMDDNIMHIPESNPVFNLYMHEATIPWNQIMAMRFSSAVAVSCAGLVSAYAPLNDNIHVLPNCICLEDCVDVEPILQKDGKIFIFWGGSPTHKEDLTLLRQAIPTIKRRHGDKVEFVIMGGDPEYTTTTPPVMSIPFGSYSFFQQVMRSCDIGLAPMVDNVFNRGKSDLRIKELASMRLPVVASPVGEYLIPDLDVQYCTTSREWIDTISDLIDSPDRRVEASKIAWDWVQQWDIGNHIHCWTDLFEELTNVRKRRSSSKTVTVESRKPVELVPGGDRITVEQPDNAWFRNPPS